MSQSRNCKSSKDYSFRKAYYLTDKEIEQLKQDFKDSALIVQKLLQEQKDNNNE